MPLTFIVFPHLEMTFLSISQTCCKNLKAAYWAVGGKGPKSWAPVSRDIQRFLGECNIHPRFPALERGAHLKGQENHALSPRPTHT